MIFHRIDALTDTTDNEANERTDGRPDGRPSLRWSLTLCRFTKIQLSAWCTVPRAFTGVQWTPSQVTVGLFWHLNF